MIKELIDIQRGSKATCAVIKNSESNKLENALYIDSRIENSWLFGARLGNPIFREKLDILSRSGSIGYFIITNFDLLNQEDQNKYIPLIKDREFMGYNLPDNIIIVLTVENKETLKNISPEIYHFCVVTF